MVTICCLISGEGVAMQKSSFQQDTGLGILDHIAATQAATSASNTSNRKKNYVHWTEKERFQIGKYAAENGHAATVRKFNKKEKPLNESTVRRFCKCYKDELKKSTKENREIKKELTVMPRGRPLMLGSLDAMVQKYLRAYRSRGGPVNSLIALSVAKVLIERNPQLSLGHLDLDSSSWSKSLFQRMGFTRRMKTTGKVEIPEGAKKEAELMYLHSITSLVEEHNIPHSLIMNLDQTPLKYVPVSHRTMAKRGAKSVSIAGSSDKRCITGTFVITMEGCFLPMQLIYGGKTKQSLPRFKFPESFSLSVNPKHFSNTEESVKIVNEIIVPYVEAEREKLANLDQAALLILDVFRGQLTKEVTDLLQDNKIFFVTVPNNMTHIFQPLDLTVNGHCKSFMKKLFAGWFAKQFDKQLTLGKKVEDIELKFQLTEMKPIHAKWLIEFYNEMSTKDGIEVIINGWKRSGIFEAVTKGSTSLPSIDPFQEIAPLPEGEYADADITYPIEVNEDFSNSRDDEDSDDSDWGFNEDDFDRNAFDFIVDDD